MILIDAHGTRTDSRSAYFLVQSQLEKSQRAMGPRVEYEACRGGCLKICATVHRQETYHLANKGGYQAKEKNHCIYMTHSETSINGWDPHESHARSHPKAQLGDL